MQNLSVRDGVIDAVYDWDSVAATEEMGALAASALTFGVDWSIAQPRRFSTPDEIAAFVAEYGPRAARRSRTTSGHGWRSTSWSSLAYGARCEHADRGRPPRATTPSADCLARARPAPPRRRPRRAQRLTSR